MENEYGGNWITTYTGRKFHFLDPQPDEIDICDIAHHLSNNCRFVGACDEHYSIAEHSIRVANIVLDKYKLQALLHDGSEAYMPDLPRPEKACLPEFRAMEAIIQGAIFKRFGIDQSKLAHETIKGADNVMLATEARDLMDNTRDWVPLPEPLEKVIVPMPPEVAEELFLSKFNNYYE